MTAGSAHGEVVEKAGWWLRERLRCCPVLLEPGFGAVEEHPDAIGFKADASTLIECKASRADFLADKTKEPRQHGGMGVCRFYMAPAGVLFVEELPEGWGYLELRGRKGIAAARVFRVVEPAIRDLSRLELNREQRMLAGALANVQYRVRGFAIGTGKHQTHNIGPDPRVEYWRGYDRGCERERARVPGWIAGVSP